MPDSYRVPSWQLNLGTRIAAEHGDPLAAWAAHVRKHLGALSRTLFVKPSMGDIVVS